MVNQIATDIVEVFEDLLERHNIIIPDEDRPDDNNTQIFGCTYGDLVDLVGRTIIKSLENKYGRLKEKLIDIVSEREGMLDSVLTNEELDKAYCSAVLKMDAIKCAIQVLENDESRIL